MAKIIRTKSKAHGGITAREKQLMDDHARLYHVYVETMQVETITPDFQDAQRAFRRAAREYPLEQIDFDVIEGLAPGEGMQDVAEGVHSGRRVRVMQQVPELA